MSGFHSQFEVENPKKLKDFNQRNYATVSLCCLSVTNPFRERIIRIVLNPWFDRFILFVILVNCGFLATDDPNKPPYRYQVISDYIFILIFTLEMFLKVIAMGFAFRPYSYMRDAWNVVNIYYHQFNGDLQLDFIVVIMGWVSVFVDTNNVSAIRVIRILRPLRTINSIPSMRNLVQSILNSLPTMLDVFILFMFFLVTFGTIATQLFGGLLTKRCVDFSGNIGEDEYGNELFCNNIQGCSSYYTCQYVGNPDYGISNFDNILTSDLNIFIVITLEGWSNLMYYIRHATGTYSYDIFFNLTIIFGSFFIINLMVAVQFSYLSQQYQEDKQKQLRNKEMEKDNINEIKAINSEQQQSIFQEAVNNIPGINDDGVILEEEIELHQDEQNMQKQKKKCCKCQKLKNFQSYIKIHFVESRAINIFIIVLILINTIFMALEHYDQPQVMSKVLNYGNSTLTCVFAVEMILKLIGLGIKQYIMDGFNVFDAIIVVIGMLEFANVGSKAITVLRAFRLLRIFKIVRSWKSLKKLLQTVLASLVSIANLALLMCLLIFIYSLIGMQFLTGDIILPDGSTSRYNFNSFGESVVTIFILLTAENWNSILLSFMNKNGNAVVIFFVTMIIFGNIMLLNLFLAILLNFISENLDQEEIEGDNNDSNNSNNEIVEEELDYIQERLRIRSQQQRSQSNVQSNKNNQQEEQQQQNQNNNEDVQGGSNQLQNPIQDVNNINEIKKITEKTHEDNSHEPEQIKDIFQIESDPNPNNQENEIAPAKIPLEFENNNNDDENNDENVNNIEQDVNNSNRNGSISSTVKRSLITKLSSSRTFKLKNKSKIHNISGKSLFIFNQDSKIRKILKYLLEHPYFEDFIFHLIGLNSLLLALDQPILNDLFQLQTIDLLTNIISGIFIAEAICKIIVLGFVFGKECYLRDPWNILDFTIVFFSLLNWILDNLSKGISISFLRGFRALRALRPLRMVSKNEGMKIVVNSLLTSIPSLVNVVLINILFLLVFGILAVQLFKGQMGYCNDSEVTYKNWCEGTYYNYEGEQLQRQWIVPFNNFDNVLYAMVTFFEVATLEGWPDILIAVIDSQGSDLGPKQGNRPYVAALFVVFIFITTFFVMNLFISVIVDKFNEEIRKKEGSHKFSQEQKEWVKMQRIMLHVSLKIRPVPPKNSKFRRIFFKIVINQKFEYFIIFVIILNTLFLCMDYQQKSAYYDSILEKGNILFVSIFTCEALMKIIAHGPRFYFLENWNKFDFIIILLSLLAIDDSLFSFKVNALRIIRVARLLRMVKASKGLRNLLKALWHSLGNIFNVSMILCLVFFTFSVAGMDLFGNITEGVFMNSDCSFRTFYISLQTLFRCSTGENWNAIMHDCFNNIGLISIFYWIAFELVAKYIFLNVFIAVIYENFNDVKASEDESEVLSLKRKDIKAFIRTWAIFCPNGEHYMKTTQFYAFLSKLPPPLGYGGINIESNKLNKIVFCLNIRNHIKDNEGKVYFPEVMWSIFHSIVGNNDEKVQKCEQVVNIMKQLKRKYKGLGKNVTPDRLCGNKYYRTEMTVSKYLCALQILKNWKNFKQLKAAQQAQLARVGVSLDKSNEKSNNDDKSINNRSNLQSVLEDVQRHNNQVAYSDQSDTPIVEKRKQTHIDENDMNSSRKDQAQLSQRKVDPLISKFSLRIDDDDEEEAKMKEREESKSEERLSRRSRQHNQEDDLLALALQVDNKIKYQESSESFTSSNFSESITSNQLRNEKLDDTFKKDMKPSFAIIKGRNVIRDIISSQIDDQVLETEQNDNLNEKSGIVKTRQYILENKNTNTQIQNLE